MLGTIASVLKYSALVLLVLVLSHIIQIKGTTISEHVENGMNWVSNGGKHARSITKISQHFSSARMDSRSEKDSEGFTTSDQQELNTVIRDSSHSRKR